ncbi:MAG: tetratricopeptide repeat protein [Cyanobacteria bacterium J06597_16]
MSRLSSSALAVPSVESAIQQATQQATQQGIQCTLAGDYSKAIELFSQALLITPDNADIYGNRCVARHRSGDRAGAIADCRKAAELYKRQGNLARYHYALRSLDRLQKSQADVSHCSSTTEEHHSYAR